MKSWRQFIKLWIVKAWLWGVKSYQNSGNRQNWRLIRQVSLEIALHFDFNQLLRNIHTCNIQCLLFQITSWPAVPTLKGSGMSSLTAHAVHLGSRGVLPTPCFTWCGSALYFFVSVIRYELQMSMCTRFHVYWCTTFLKDHAHFSPPITC